MKKKKQKTPEIKELEKNEWFNKKKYTKLNLPLNDNYIEIHENKFETLKFMTKEYQYGYKKNNDKLIPNIDYSINKNIEDLEQCINNYKDYFHINKNDTIEEQRNNIKNISILDGKIEKYEKYINKIKSDMNIKNNEMKPNIIKKIKIYCEKKKKEINKYVKFNCNDTIEQKINKIKDYENKKILKEIEKNNNNTVIRCIKVPLHLTNNQIDIIDKWKVECKRVYDYCVDKYNDDKNYFNIGIQRKVEIFNELYGKEQKPVSYDVLSDEIRKFISNLKSNLTQVKMRIKKKFTMKYKDISKSQVIGGISYRGLKIKTQIITNEKNEEITNKVITIYPETLKPIIIDESEILKDLQINHDCSIQYYKRKNKYILNVPIDVEIQNEIYNREKIVAIDAGVSKFITYYTDNKFGHIGGSGKEVLDKNINNIKKYTSILAKNKNKNEKKLKNKRKIKNKIQENYDQIKNKVKELHNQTALFLCKNYETIVLPRFESSKMSNIKKKIKEIKEMQISDELKKYKLKKLSKDRRIERNMNNLMYKLSHYKFRQHLQSKCIEYGCKFVETISESYTSQICTKCGEISKVYNIREKECQICKYRIDRDINASRNIYLKYLTLNNRV